MESPPQHVCQHPGDQPRCWLRDDVEADVEASYFHPYLALHRPTKRARWAGMRAPPPDKQPHLKEHFLELSTPDGGQTRLRVDDTMVVRNLPAKWFELGPERAGRGLYEPSISPLYRLFSMFGPLRDIDIQLRPIQPFSASRQRRPSPTRLILGQSAADLLQLGDEEEGSRSMGGGGCPACELGGGCPPPLHGEEVQRQLGPLMDVWARFQSCEGLTAALQGLTGCLLSSVTEEVLLVELEVAVDRDGHFQANNKRRPGRRKVGAGPIGSPAVVSPPTSPGLASAPMSPATETTMSLAGGGGLSTTTATSSTMRTADPLLQHKLQEALFELIAQVRVMAKDVEEQRHVLKQEIEGYKPSAWRAALEAQPAAGGPRPLLITSAGGGAAAFAKELDAVQALIQGAADSLHGLLGPDVVAVSPEDVSERRRLAKRSVKGASKALDRLEARLRRTIAHITEAEMQRPPLEGLLLDEGLSLFLRAARAKRRPPALVAARHGALPPRPPRHGLTVLAPVDDAFLGDPGLFEEECWDVHVVEGMYTIADLARLKQVPTISFQLQHTLRVQKDPQTNAYCVWRKKESEPLMKARVLRADVFCQDRIVVHVVDRILFPIS